jgi:hypothetical protein
MMQCNCDEPTQHCAEGLVSEKTVKRHRIRDERNRAKKRRRTALELQRARVRVGAGERKAQEQDDRDPDSGASNPDDVDDSILLELEHGDGERDCGRAPPFEDSDDEPLPLPIAMGADSDGGAESANDTGCSSATSSSTSSSSSSSSSESEDPDERKQRPRARRARVDIATLNCPLYGGTTLTLYAVLLLLFAIQTRHKLSQRCMSDFFDVICCILPVANHMVSYNVAQELIAQCGLGGSRSIDVCVKDCVFFKSGQKHCPRCKEPRFSNKKARRKFRWFPLKQQIQQLFKDPKFADLIRLRRRPDLPPSDLHNSPGWNAKVWDDGFGDENGGRNLVLTLCIDGVTPFPKSNYSMSPVLVRVENLAPEVHMA